MEPYTLGRDYLKKDIIDGFSSVIWTERYYGDSKVELVVPLTPSMIDMLSVGAFLGLEESNELMILETMNIEDGKLKLSGISVLSWLNNRFVRTSASHNDRYWYLDGESPGWILWAMVYYMCVGGPYLDGTTPTGIPNPSELVVPGLGLYDYDRSGSPQKVGIPYGPLYDAMLEFAKTYEIGMQIILDINAQYPLQFRSYKGLDRTSGQTENPVIRFSPEMDSLTDIKEIQSIANFKTRVYSFAPGLNPAEGETDLRTTPGISILGGSEYIGFDLRAKLLFAEDITTDQVGGSSSVLLDILENRAYTELTNNKYIRTVDGEIVPDSQFQYGVHYNLGDIIEVEGNSGTIQESRITEYIRSHDSSGEKAYPTVTGIS
jgi:hypothetical protein